MEELNATGDSALLLPLMMMIMKDFRASASLLAARMAASMTYVIVWLIPAPLAAARAQQCVRGVLQEASQPASWSGVELEKNFSFGKKEFYQFGENSH